MQTTLVEGHRAIECPAGVPAWDIDPYDPEILGDPLRYYSELRSKGDFVFIPRYAILACGRYDVTKTVFSDYEHFVSSRGVGLSDYKLQKPWRQPSIILEADPPDHTRTRKVMTRALSPKVIKTLQQTFRETAEEMIGGLLDRGAFEAVADLAEVFPTTVFPRAVGMLEVDTRRLLDYGAMSFDSVGPDNAIRRRALDKVPDVVPWITAACSRDRLKDDGLGAIIYAAADEGEITIAEADMLIRSFFAAGVDTTVTGIGNTLWCLAQNPDAFEALKASPALARPCFEEVLRYTSPVHTFARTANTDCVVAGHEIQQDTKIICVLAAANLDPEKWEDAETFRIDRNPVGHLAFGAGIHGCVGQNIARAEVEAILGAVIEKVDRITLEGEAVWRPSNAIHTLDRLPLRFHAK